MRVLSRIFCMFMALQCFWVTPSLASPVPTDIAAFSGPSGWTQVTPLYKTDGTQNVPIDSTVTPMPVGAGMTNVPIPSTTGRIGATTQNEMCSGSGSGCSFKLTNIHGGFGGEAKFRTQSDFSHMAPDDPIRNFGQPGSSHLHCFFGSSTTNAYSTYKSLRAHSLQSFAVGTDANDTGYWYPCAERLNPYGDSKNFAIKPDFITIYYTQLPTDGENSAHIPTGLRYVFGFDMDSSDPIPASATHLNGQYSWLWTILAAANTASGSSRYSLTNPNGMMATQGGWICSGATIISGQNLGNGRARSLVTSTGADPFGGTCASGQDLFMRIDGATCYDGTNLWSNGGYKHLIPAIWDSLYSKFVCPYNYYRLPGLTLELHYQNYGPSDYMNWQQSSDIAYRAAHSLSTTDVPNGLTFHTDWMDGWDRDVRLVWENNCIGVEHQNSHECNSSVISSTQLLLGETNTAGVIRSKQVDTTAETRASETDRGWMCIPSAWSGSMTNMHLHGSATPNSTSC